MNWVKNIDWSPLDYVEAAIAAEEAAEGLFSRLEWLTIKPQRIVDMGSGPGTRALRLQKQYPDAEVLAIDLSIPMITEAYQRQTKAYCICADAQQLPLPSQSVDLIFANLMLPWHAEMTSLLREWRRILRPKGALVLSALGPDTLKECAELREEQGVPDLVDMHVIGDWLLAEKFSDPVLEVDYLTLSYKDISRLFYELHASGMLKINPEHGKRYPLFPAADGRFEITYEVIFAHAFVMEEKEEKCASKEGIVRVPLTDLRKRLRTSS